MYNVKVLTIGKLKNKSLKKEIDELQKRISRFEIIELKEISGNNVLEIKKKEFDLLKSYLSNDSYKVLLWEFGKTLNTKDFHSYFKKQERDVIFVITGAFGPSDELKNLCNYNLSLSPMTFTHEQALYLLVEQIYRYQCFEKGIDYNK